ncbi:hypothetical protein CLV43_111201 [Umezawaea tangerina]|uniref:Uncharacterized protein n=1 Tax=Umezawaea tangerina TaxID=84725 RepID=A0A2T0STT7_9PSEU|nr:hypothetical protein [Umezawaea tangerina]PRY36829.1 hypothetical protein CLV43_111201 [Umezawaea tangerina]
MDLAGPGLTVLTGADVLPWNEKARGLDLIVVAVTDPDRLVDVELPADGAPLPRPDAIVAWHSGSGVPLEEAVAHVLDKAPALRA